MRIILVFLHRHCIDLTSLRQHIGYVVFVNHGTMIYLHRRTCLVDEVDGLVGQKTVVDILIAGIDGKVECLFIVAYAMKLLVLLAQLS